MRVGGRNCAISKTRGAHHGAMTRRVAHFAMSDDAMPSPAKKPRPAMMRKRSSVLAAERAGITAHVDAAPPPPAEDDANAAAKAMFRGMTPMPMASSTTPNFVRCFYRSAVSATGCIHATSSIFYVSPTATRTARFHFRRIFVGSSEAAGLRPAAAQRAKARARTVWRAARIDVTAQARRLARVSGGADGEPAVRPTQEGGRQR